MALLLAGSSVPALDPDIGGQSPPRNCLAWVLGLSLLVFLKRLSSVFEPWFLSCDGLVTFPLQEQISQILSLEREVCLFVYMGN